MAEDWAADVKKYAPNADDNVIAGIVRYCGIALTKRDSSLVAMSDKKETDRVRENFLKKKLGRTEADSALDAEIAAVGQQMKEDRTKNRVTVYYLLAAKFDSLGMFLKASNAKAKAPAKASGAAAGKPAAKIATKTTKAPTKPKVTTSGAGAAAVAAGGAALGLAAMGGESSGGAPAANDDGAGAKATAALGAAGAAVTGAASAAADTAGAAGAAVVGAAGAAAVGAAALASGAGSAVSGGVDRMAGAASSLVGGDDEGGSSWLWWLLGGLLALFAIWWFFLRGPDTDGAAVPAATEAAATASAAAPTDLASAPAEGSVAIPAGAGVTSELRDGKPVVKVYFASGKTDVVPDFAASAAGLKAYLASHAGSKLSITGFADPSGNAAFNEQLSKQRAEAVQAALVAAGIPETSTELVKPSSATDATVNRAAARRVEVVAS
jgi:outer membrane protein OmpA-like peptidoglycan-associated protein